MSSVMTKTGLARQFSESADVHKSVLDRAHNTLVENLMFDAVHDYLITKQAFPTVTLADIKDEPKTSWKIKSLLEHLKKANFKTYTKFKDALVYAQQPHLLKKLTKLEQEVYREFKVGVSPHPTDEMPSSPIAQPDSIRQDSGLFRNIHDKQSDGCP